MPSQYTNGSEAYDLYRTAPAWQQGSAAPQLPQEPQLPDLPEPQEQAEQKVVVRARAEISVVALLGAVVVLALLVLVVSGYVRLYELSSVHTQLSNQLTALEAEQTRLETSYENQMNIDQIELVAVSEMGMHLPRDNQIVYLNMSGEDSAVVYASDSVAVNSVAQAVKNGVGYLIDRVKAYIS